MHVKEQLFRDFYAILFGQIVILIFLFHCWWKVAIFSSSGSKNQELNNDK